MERIGCPPGVKNTEACRYFNTGQSCIEDVHHKYYPRKDYTSPTEKKFRELDENKELTCRDRHNEIHATEKPPVKPDLFIMVEAVRLARAGLRNKTKKKGKRAA